MSEEQVAINRETYGVNQLEEKEKTPLIVKFFAQFKDPLIIILIIAAVVSMIIDPHEWVESLIIMVVVLVNAILGLYQENKAEKSLEALQKMSAATCKVVRGGRTLTIDTASLVVGDIILVEAGDSIPADARIIECSNLKVEEAALTGESVPVDKSVGDIVSAATINQSGFIKCEATRVGEDTTLSQIIKLVREASATKAPIAKIADKVSGIFVPVVMAIALLVFVVWMILGKNVGFSLTRAISVLVISCPCALGLATPVAIMVGNGKGAKNGILFKTASSLEMAARTQIVALDKTGTITKGEPEVTDIIGEENLLQIAYSLEKKSEHPLAKAIVKYGEENGISALETTDFVIFAGGGLKASLEEETICGGNADYVKKYVDISAEFLEKANIISKNSSGNNF